jgi:hypothetical protein
MFFIDLVVDRANPGMNILPGSKTIVGLRCGVSQRHLSKSAGLFPLGRQEYRSLIGEN